jgi:tetratricopeptide (TPR) repeat protein
MEEWNDAEKHVERAHDLYEAGRWEEAEAELRRALALRPLEPEWNFNLGLTLEAAGRPRDASEAFARAAELSTEDGQPALMAGRCLLDAGDDAGAVEWLERAQQIDGDLVMSYVHRIEAYTHLGQHDQAELMFYLAQQREPRNVEALIAMADSLLGRELHEKAIWCLKEALEVSPDQDGVHARLAEAYAATGRHERARQLYLRELRRNPGDIDTLLDLGALLVEMNRGQEASEKFRRVLELDPEDVDAHFQLARLAEMQGDAEEAIRQFDVVHRLDADFPGVRRRLASLLMDRRTRDPKRVDDLLQRELTRFENEPERFEAAALVELGNLLLDAGLTREASRVLKRLVEVSGKDAGAHHLLSVALLELGEIEAGKEAARTALSIDDRLVPAMHNLAIACLRERRWRRARKWLKRARKVEPDEASLRRLSYAIFWYAIRDTIGRLLRI